MVAAAAFTFFGRKFFLFLKFFFMSLPSHNQFVPVVFFHAVMLAILVSFSLMVNVFYLLYKFFLVLYLHFPKITWWHAIPPLSSPLPLFFSLPVFIVRYYIHGVVDVIWRCYCCSCVQVAMLRHSYIIVSIVYFLSFHLRLLLSVITSQKPTSL